MNKTNLTDCVSNEEACLDYIVSLSVVASMFIVSEILPFLRGIFNKIKPILTGITLKFKSYI